MDKGYDYGEVRAILRAFGFTAHIRSRGEEAKEIAREAGKRARRWVVERSHSWLNRFRRSLIRWESALPGLPAFCLLLCVPPGYSDRLLVETAIISGVKRAQIGYSARSQPNSSASCAAGRAQVSV